MQCTRNRRILIIDDNPLTHADFRRVLCGGRLALLGAKKLTRAEVSPALESEKPFEIASAYQIDQGLEMIALARQHGRPYALTSVDLRLPPDQECVDTIERICQLDPEIQLVICSAYADYLGYDIPTRAGVADRLLMLRKPMDTAESLLISTMLCEKWNLARAAQTKEPPAKSAI